MFTPSAKILADSISVSGHRLTTVEVTGHRFILAEFNTHRAFSRNSASSRAIPYAKMRAKALEQTAYPISWPAEKSGMQGGADLDGVTQVRAATEWTEAALSAVKHADKLYEMGLHKSVVNRLLEPFLPHTIIVSATNWQGFWAQRCHRDAQPEIRALAESMRQKYINGNPRVLETGLWHLPLIQEDDYEQVPDAARRLKVHTRIILQRISVARCARVSYLTHDGKRDIEKDLELYDRLRNHEPAHASPFGHVATPGIGTGNFRGWNQLRHIEGLK